MPQQAAASQACATHVWPHAPWPLHFPACRAGASLACLICAAASEAQPVRCFAMWDLAIARTPSGRRANAGLLGGRPAAAAGDGDLAARDRARLQRVALPPPAGQRLPGAGAPAPLWPPRMLGRHGVKPDRVCHALGVEEALCLLVRWGRVNCWDTDAGLVSQAGDAGAAPGSHAVPSMLCPSPKGGNLSREGWDIPRPSGGVCPAQPRRGPLQASKLLGTSACYA